MVRVDAAVHPTQVRPAVLHGEFVHRDNEEVSGGVVVQGETSVSHQLVVFVCPYQVTGHVAIVVAEVLSVVPKGVWIVTPEVKSLAFHTGDSFGFDTDQSCQSK